MSRIKDSISSIFVILKFLLRYTDNVPLGIRVASSPSAYPIPVGPSAQDDTLLFRSFQLAIGSEFGMSYLNKSPWLIRVLA